MADEIIPVPDCFADARINAERYQAMYRRSLLEPDAFWREEMKRIDWITEPTRISDISFAKEG